MAIARRLLEEDSLELFVQPAFRDRSMANSLALYVSSKSKRAMEGVVSNVSKAAVNAAAQKPQGGSSSMHSRSQASSRRSSSGAG